MKHTVVCKIHGEGKGYLEKGRKNARCVKCRSYAVQKRRDTLKEMAVSYKGGKCEKCGYAKVLAALEFHHIMPDHKDFGISKGGYIRAWSKIKEELDKCILVCANCHRELHNNKTVPVKINVDWPAVTGSVKVQVLHGEPNKCKVCFKEINKYSTFCRKCFPRKAKIVWPETETLKSMVDKLGYSEAGRCLGVSDNAVRKRLTVHR